MKIIEVTSDIAEMAKVQQDCVLTIGNFDGVHLGHQEILATARRIATERNADFVVMTFEPHPLAVLHPQRKPGILTPLALKKHILAELKVDCLLVVQSTPELLSLSPQNFIQRFLLESIGPAVVVEGRSFNFGSGRTGSVDVMQKLGATKGFEVVVVDSKEVKMSTGQSVAVSSTVIRDLLQAGSVADAAVALGKAYRLIGQVVPGRGKGKQLGFPTANMHPPQQLIPAEGVYAGFSEITLAQQHTLLIEAHLLTKHVGQLYDKWLAMDFIERLRDQQKFKTESQLSAQIAKDCEKARLILPGRG